jgi:DNA-binding transcriptional MocR family regulator
LGFTLRGLPIDNQGILPDAFEAACAVGDVSALVIVSSLGNPTSHVMGAERRRAIADIARRYGIFVIEDEVYKPMMEEPLPSMPDLLPELGFFVTSFTKSVMTGLRIGYLVVPAHYSIRVASILRVTGWSATNVVAEMASRWVLDGTANALITIQRAEAKARQAIVSEVLGPFVAGSHPLSLCAWLSVPERWTEEGLVRALARKGVAVTPSEPFIAASERPAGGIRVCLGGRLSHSALRSALTTVRTAFEQLPPIFDVGAIV